MTESILARLLSSQIVNDYLNGIPGSKNRGAAMTTRYYIRKRRGLWRVYRLAKGHKQPDFTQGFENLSGSLEEALEFVSNNNIVRWYR